MSCHHRDLPGRHDLLAMASALPERYPCLLQSVLSGTPSSRHDILFAFPQDRLTLEPDGLLRDGSGRLREGGFLDALDAAWQAARTGAASDGLPFHGGWVLLLCYELAEQIEPSVVLAPPEVIPRALALRCPAAIIVDHLRGRTVLVAEAGEEALLDVLQADLLGSAGIPTSGLPQEWEEDPPECFLDGVQKVKQHLHAGDIFQANLSRAWRARYATAPTAAALYAALRVANPAPFAGMLQQPGWAVISSSPERLIEVRNGVVQTRPIAGTRARIPGDDEAACIDELCSHPKERAEHVMLIDLERNDLGRICEPGSVVVDELMAVESYADVHHIVSNVRGRLREGVTPGQVIAATFPGGTITGCPKVRCMQIISELEDAPRGAYTGSMGYLDRSGAMDLNILIRTISQIGTEVSLRAGAGIVADSDAACELAETRAKARAVLRALGVVE